MKSIKDQGNSADSGGCRRTSPKTVHDDSTVKQELVFDEECHKRSPIREKKIARQHLNNWDAQQKKTQ